MNIDWSKVKSAVEQDESLLSFDRGDAFDLAKSTAEKFLPEDLETFDILEIEQKKEVKGIRYIVDFKARHRKTGAIWLHDWKTTKNTLDAEWRDRLIDSWQWRIYDYLEGADKFSYRGLSRLNGEAVELIIDRPETNEEEVRDYLFGVRRQMLSLIPLNSRDGLDTLVWPRHMPYACHAFGRECKYYAGCRSYETIPRGLSSKWTEGGYTLSYSSIEDFLLCPEKFRLNHLLEGPKDESEESAFGHAVHRGLAEAYRQGAGLDVQPTVQDPA